MREIVDCSGLVDPWQRWALRVALRHAAREITRDIGGSVSITRPRKRPRLATVSDRRRRVIDIAERLWRSRRQEHTSALPFRWDRIQRDLIEVDPAFQTLTQERALELLRASAVGTAVDWTIAAGAFARDGAGVYDTDKVYRSKVRARFEQARREPKRPPRVR